MNAATEIEALMLVRDINATAERRELNRWQSEDEDEGVRRRFESFLASLGVIFEKSGSTQTSDLL